MIPSGARVWIAMGHTDMRKGMQGLALLVQQGLKRDPHGGDLFAFRWRAGALVKMIWHDGIGMSLYAKRLEKVRFVWPSAKDGMVSLTSAQLAACSMGSTGVTRSIPGVRRAPDRALVFLLGPHILRFIRALFCDSISVMEVVVSPLPHDSEALKALLASATLRADEAEAKLANAHTRESATEAVIAHLKLQIAKLRREQYGASAERTRRLLDQVELQLEELRPTPPRTTSLLKSPPRGPRPSPPSNASGRPGSRFPSTCRANASSCRRRALVRPVAAAGCPGWRGHHRDARADPARLEGHPDRAREVLLPRL